MSFVVSGAILGSGFIEVMLKKQEKKSEQAMEESIRISLTRALSSNNITFPGALMLKCADFFCFGVDPVVHCTISLFQEPISIRQW